MEYNKVYLGDCIDVMKSFTSDCIDLTVTSPPYDNLRTYNATCEWNFDVFKQVAEHLIANGVTVQECGQWIYDFNLAGSNFYHCSVCDRQETLLEKEDIYEYCPFCHCGAKMLPQPPKGE